MIEPVSQRTYARIEELTREATLSGHRVRYCPCRVLPETVLSLKGVMQEIERLWRQDLGDELYERLQETSGGDAFFAGTVHIALIQEGRPKMVAAWFRVPPDYPRRMKVQLIDAIEPFPLPGTQAP